MKRAKVSAGGQPPVGTSGAPLVVLSSPDSSPRQSPQRKFITLPPVDMCLGHDTFGADLARYAGGEQQQKEPQRATPNTPPPLTTPPRGASPVRAPGTGPTHMEEEEDLGAGGFASMPNIGGEGTSVSQPGTGTVSRSPFVPASFSFRLLVLALPHPFFGVQIRPR